MKRVLISAAALIAAGASDGRAENQVTLGRSGMSQTFIWLDHAAYKDGIKLIEAKFHETNPALIFRLMACVARPGDHAVIVDRGAFSHTVVVVDGAKAGCRGFVTREDVTE